nr:hypothetical protein CFP56_76648 [Quercus suber]
MEIWPYNELALLNNEDDGLQWHGLKSLRSLCLMGITKLVSLPDGLQHFMTLQQLIISERPSLIASPDRKQFLQEQMKNHLRQRTNLGLKFEPYSKTAIAQQVKNSVNHRKFLSTLRAGLNQATTLQNCANYGDR